MTERDLRGLPVDIPGISPAAIVLGLTRGGDVIIGRLLPAEGLRNWWDNDDDHLNIDGRAVEAVLFSPEHLRADHGKIRLFSVTDKR